MLSPDEQSRLFAAAQAAREQAYCPYSGYAVGAALLDDRGQVACATNVENASYGLSLCAERAAIAVAVADGLQPGGLRAVAVCGGTTEAPITPCGACRQVLAEFAAPDCVVLCGAPGAGAATLREYRLSELLPNAFRME